MLLLLLPDTSITSRDDSFLLTSSNRVSVSEIPPGSLQNKLQISHTSLQDKKPTLPVTRVEEKSTRFAQTHWPTWPAPLLSSTAHAHTDSDSLPRPVRCLHDGYFEPQLNLRLHNVVCGASLMKYLVKWMWYERIQAGIQHKRWCTRSSNDVYDLNIFLFSFWV